MLGLAVPPATARILSELDVPGKREDVSHYHVTLLHLGDEVPIEDVSEMMVAAYSAVKATPPFTVTTSEVKTFPKGPDGFPVICPIASPELHELHSTLCRKFDELGLDYSKKFPVYRPHMTLAYSPDNFEGFQITPVSWGAHELTLWGGDSGSGRILINIPLAASRTASAADEVTARYYAGVLMRDRIVHRFRDRL